MARLLLVPKDIEGLGDAMPRYIAGEHVAFGFRKWIEHLAALERQLGIAELELSSAEVDGIQLLRAAREEFSRSHVACPQCGATVDRITAAAGMTCRCGHKF